MVTLYFINEFFKATLGSFFDITRSMIANCGFFVGPSLIWVADDEDASAARRGHRLDDPRAPHAVVRRRELAVLHRDHEGLRHEIEVFGALKNSERKKRSYDFNY